MNVRTDTGEVLEPDAVSMDHNSADASFHYVFGSSSGLRDSVQHVSEDSVCYTAGHHVVIQNVESKAMRFIEQSEHSRILAMSVSPNMKYLAVCEKRAEERGIASLVSVYNLANSKRVRTMNQPEGIPNEVVACMFGGDSRVLVTLGSGPEWPIIYWNWEKHKVIATVAANSAAASALRVNRLSINQWDNFQLCTTGPNFCKFWKLMDNGTTLKGFNAILPRDTSKLPPMEYTDHCWVDKDRVVAPTSRGDLFIFDGGEMKTFLAGIHPAGESITNVAPTTRGFVLLGDGGFVGIYEKALDKGVYYPLKLIFPNSRETFASVSVSPTQEHFVASFTSNQIGVFALSAVDTLDDDVNHFQYFSGGLHWGAITTMDLAKRKPWIVTAGVDRTVRIWNYLTKANEVTKTFHEEPLTVAIHPSGFEVLVSFHNRLYLFSVLASDLHCIQEYQMKAARKVCFSNGGQYFAAASGSVISIFSTYTYACIGSLKGHNGEVHTISWSSDDQYLVSGGVDGAIYEWKVLSFMRASGDHVLKTCSYSSAVYDHENKTVAACGSDKKVRAITQGVVGSEMSTGSQRITTLTFSKSGTVLYAGTATGHIYVFSWPLQSNVAVQPLMLPVHKEAITALYVTPEDNYLFTAGEDGCIFMLDIKLVCNGAGIPMTEPDYKNFNDTVMVSRSELEEKDEAKKDLMHRIEDMKVDIDFKLLMKEQHWKEVLKHKEEEYDGKSEQEAAKYAQLRKMKEIQEVEAADSIRVMEEAHMKAAQELENLYEQRLAAEHSRYEVLDKEKADLQCTFEEEFSSVRDGYEELVQQMKTTHQSELDEIKKQKATLEEEIEAIEAAYEEMLRQQEQEYEYEIQLGKDSTKKKVNLEKENALTLKGETLVMRKKFEAMKIDMEQLRKQVKARQQEIDKLDRTVDQLNRTITMLKGDVKERDETIAEKEKRIAELNGKLNELTKFKFVLDYKINELKREIEPRDIQIQEMKDQIKEMDDELEKDNRDQSQMEIAINEKTHKINALNRELQRIRVIMQDKDRTIGSFSRDLFHLVTKREPAQWRDAILHIYHTYVTKEAREQLGMTLDASEEDKMKEFTRQRKFMESALSAFKNNQGAIVKRARNNILQKVNENSFLIDEINTLRLEKSEMQRRIARLTGQLRDQNVGDQVHKRGVMAASKQRAAQAASSRPQTAGASRPSTAASTRSVGTARSGKLVKGSTQKWEMSAQQRMQMAEMLLQIEENNSEMEMQRVEIRRLRQQVQYLLERAPIEELDEMLDSKDFKEFASSAASGGNDLAQRRDPGEGQEYRPVSAAAMADMGAATSSSAKSPVSAAQRSATRAKSAVPGRRKPQWSAGASSGARRGGKIGSKSARTTSGGGAGALPTLGGRGK